MAKKSPSDPLPRPMRFPYSKQKLEDMLSKEWLLPNKIGAYASSSALGCNTRRYHGLLIASAAPPVQRIAALATVMEQVRIGSGNHDLATNEFSDAFSPRGMEHLVEFVHDVMPRWVYRVDGVEIVKELILAEAANAVAVRYTVRGSATTLLLWPFAALRDYHSLRKVHQSHQMTFENRDEGIVVLDRQGPPHTLCLRVEGEKFEAKPQWWYRFLYRQDVARGQEGYEDLYTPGFFACTLADGQVLQLTASLDEFVAVDFDAAVAARRRRLAELAGAVGPQADETTRRLAVATDAFIVQRDFPAAAPQATVLAGYHWFADWGRDAFVALPGLLLATGRFDQAREVFRTFVGHLSGGLIPNRFDDYSNAAHYNSIDASLWFIVAAERYLEATGDQAFWRDVLMPAAHAILAAYHNGTKFDIHADADGLLKGGSPTTQLTWMDVKLGEEAITPRQGKAVEVNALWYCAHRILGLRGQSVDRTMAEQYAHQADLIAPAFAKAFWNPSQNCLYDCISDSGPDAAIRPNQIFAVSLPHSPLPPAQQVKVVQKVREQLLTPLGLRSLSPLDSRYRRRYGGSWESRDRAYHQGTVWAWLAGPYVEAVLKVADDKAKAVAEARRCLQAFGPHLAEAGLGSISEIFDGDPPHEPHGCIAQAWSVGEVLRAKVLVEQAARSLKAP
ncbi:MAG: amylo-alpha-1,6-glucosidase [Phycisphaerae bacterium]